MRAVDRSPELICIGYLRLTHLLQRELVEDRDRGSAAGHVLPIDEKRAVAARRPYLHTGTSASSAGDVRTRNTSGTSPQAVNECRMPGGIQT
jgi:hypothetical protein